MKDEALKLASALDHWATQMDMGRKPDPKSLIRKASAELRRLQAELDAIKQALAAPVQPVKPSLWEQYHAAQQEHEPENEPFVSLASVQEPVAWVDLLKQAEEVVRSKSLWKKYIDGTPLANDIAVWMASFAQEHATPPAAQRPWVGLTDEELKDIELGCHKTLFGKIEAMQKVEAKLKEKNT